MKLIIVAVILLVSQSGWSAVAMKTRTESGVTVHLVGRSVISILAPVTMDGSNGRKAVLNRNLELDRDCDSVGLVVDRFTDGDALVAHCRVDSGPAVTFVASLVPPSCQSGTLARDYRGHYVCRVHQHNCAYDYNPYTWEELSVAADDNNYGCR